MFFCACVLLVCCLCACALVCFCLCAVFVLVCLCAHVCVRACVRACGWEEGKGQDEPECDLGLEGNVGLGLHSFQDLLEYGMDQFDATPALASGRASCRTDVLRGQWLYLLELPVCQRLEGAARQCIGPVQLDALDANEALVPAAKDQSAVSGIGRVLGRRPHLAKIDATTELWENRGHRRRAGNGEIAAAKNKNMNPLKPRSTMTLVRLDREGKARQILGV